MDLTRLPELALLELFRALDLHQLLETRKVCWMFKYLADEQLRARFGHLRVRVLNSSNNGGVLEFNPQASPRSPVIYDVRYQKKK